MRKKFFGSLILSSSFLFTFLASAQSVPHCDCSKLEGTCSASIVNAEAKGTGQLFALRFDMRSSVPDRCALTVLRYPNGDFYSTVTIQGGFDEGRWGYPTEFDHNKLYVESCDICALPQTNSDEGNQDSKNLESDLLSLVENDKNTGDDSEADRFRQISRRNRDDGSLLYSQLSQHERQLKLEDLSERSKAYNSQLLSEGMNTLQTVNAYVNDTVVYGNYPLNSLGEQEGRDRCNAITKSYESSIKAIPVGSSIYEQARNTIKQNKIATKALNECLKVLPEGSQSYADIVSQINAIHRQTDEAQAILESVKVETSRPISTIGTQNSQSGSDSNNFGAGYKCGDGRYVNDPKKCDWDPSRIKY